MNGSKLLLIGVLVGFGGGMAAAIGIKLVQGSGRGGRVAVEATASPGETVTPMLGAAADPPASGAGGAVEGGEPTPYGMAPAALPTPGAEAEPVATARAAKTKGGTGTRVAAIPKATPRDASSELPVEEPPAKIVFAKPTTEGAALSRITEVRAGDNSTVRMELTGKARWKILELPKRHEVWIDFEDVEVPGGEKAASGSKIHVDEIRAKTFDGGAIARVIIKLANEGKFSVSVSDGFAETVSTKGKGRTGEADGMLEVSFIGAVGGDAWATQ